MQTWLNGVRDQCSFYPALTTDGRFGTKSENAVKEFQLRNNMNMDGKVGANTWNVLYAKYTAKHGLAVPYPGIVMRTGMSGGTIRLIQRSSTRWERRSARTESSAPGLPPLFSGSSAATA